MRSGEEDEALAALVRSLPPGRSLELPLAPLDPGDLGRLVHARTGEWLPPPELARLHRASAGNPLMALELVRAAGARPATDVRRLLAQRLAPLSPEARALLRVVAALPEPAVDRVPAAGLEEALAADLVIRDGERLRFSHPLIAAVVEERTPPAEWRAVHAGLAERTEDPEQRARHLAAAIEGPDETVAAALADAATRAEARGATLAGAELRERAAVLTPPADEPRRVARLLAAAGALLSVGDGQRARGLLDGVLERAPAGPARAAALHKLAWLVTDDSALTLAREALAEAGDDQALCAEIEISAFQFAMMGGEMALAVRHAESAAKRAEAAGRPDLLANALSDLAFIRHNAGEGVQRELLERAIALERGSPRRGRDDTSREVLGLQLYINGDLAEARELLVDERERARERGNLEHEGFALLLLTELEVRAGRWQLAEMYARATLRAHGRGRTVERRGGRALDVRAGRGASRPCRLGAFARRDRPPAGGGARRPRVRDPLLARPRVPRTLARRRGRRRPPPRAVAGPRGAALDR